MATNLLIGYPDIPFRASAPTVGVGVADTIYPVANIITGPRSQHFTITTAAGIIDITHDLGASLTAPVEYYFIARANTLKAQGATQLLLKSSPDNVTYTSRIGTTAALQTRTFTGPRGEDLMFASGLNDDVLGSLPTSSIRYWKQFIGVASPTKKWQFSKSYFGTFFDFGRDPEAPTLSTSADTKDDQNRDPRQLITLTWRGVTNTIRNSFVSTLYRYREVSPVVLYDKGDIVFHGYKTLHARIKSATITPDNTQANDITVTFEELI